MAVGFWQGSNLGGADGRRRPWRRTVTASIFAEGAADLSEAGFPIPHRDDGSGLVRPVGGANDPWGWRGKAAAMSTALSTLPAALP